MEHARQARQFCLTLAVVLTGVLVMAPAQGHGKPRPPQPQWEWQVAVADVGSDLNLVSDTHGPYTDTGNDLVRVYKDTRNKYRFRLRIWNGSARQIKLQYDASSLGLSSLCYDPGPGYFPVEVGGQCQPPSPPFCCDCSGDSGECQERFVGFLNGLHPRCGYESMFLEVTVPLDIESMPVTGPTVDVRGHVELYIGNTSEILKDPSAAFHNMDAHSIPANEAPLWVRRTAANSWQVGVSDASGQMSYCEFYWGIFRGRLPENKIPMCANGPLTFETTWTREPVNE